MTEKEKSFLKSLTVGQPLDLKSILEKADKDLLVSTFESNVRLLLSFNYLTITELSGSIGVDRGYLQYVLSGKYKIYKGKQLTHITRIAQCLKVDVHTLLFIDLRANFKNMLEKIDDEP